MGDANKLAIEYIKKTADYFGLTPQEVLLYKDGEGKAKDAFEVTVYLLRKNLNMTFSDMSKLFQKQGIGDILEVSRKMESLYSKKDQ